MTLTDILNRFRTKMRVNLANRSVSKYLGVQRLPCEMRYSPDVKKIECREFNFDGEKFNGNRYFTGEADLEGVTFNGRPKIDTIEHELVHFYHINYNDSANRLMEIKRRLESGGKLTHEELLEHYTAFNFGIELPPNAYSQRSREKYIQGNILKINIDDKDWKDHIVELFNKLDLKKNDEFLLIQAFDSTDIKKAADDPEKQKSEYFYHLQKLYSISFFAGGLLLVEPNAQPKLEIIAEFDKKIPQTICIGYNIEYPMVPLSSRKHLIRSIFYADINYLANNTINQYCTMIDPLIERSYDEIYERVMNGRIS